MARPAPCSKRCVSCGAGTGKRNSRNCDINYCLPQRPARRTPSPPVISKQNRLSSTSTEATEQVKVPFTMRSMVLDKPGVPLRLVTLPAPRPGPIQVLVKIIACGICRTDLHVLDGELSQPKLPLIPWLGYTCGTCRYCRR